VSAFADSAVALVTATIATVTLISLDHWLVARRSRRAGRCR